MYRFAFHLAFFTFAAANAAHAQKWPEDVTLTQIVDYQAKQESDCVAKGRAEGSRPIAAVTSYCSCVFASLRASMTLLDWRTAYEFSLVDKRAEWGVFEKRAQPVIESCARKNLAQ